MPIALTWGSSLKAQHCQLAWLYSTLVFLQLRIRVSSERSLLHWVLSQGIMNAFSSAFWYWQGRWGIGPYQAEKLDLMCWAQICIFPRTLTQVTTGLAFVRLLMRRRPVSQQWSVLDWDHPEALCARALGTDNYYFCGCRDFLGNHSCAILHLFRYKIKGKQIFCLCGCGFL